MRIGIGLGIGFKPTNGGGGTTPPTFSVNPTISGTAVVGQTLTCDGGTVTGTEPITRSYQWYRGVTPIGTNSATYVLVQADAGNTSNIKCVVTATNGAGSVNADSNTVAQILDANYYAVLERATALGYVHPSTNCIAAQNAFMIEIKSIGLYTRCDVLYVPANDAGSDFSTLNWVNPNLHQMTLVNSPTWTTKVGFIGTGTEYLSLNYNPATDAIRYAGADSSKFGFVPTNSPFVQSASWSGSNPTVYQRLLRNSSVSINSYSNTNTAINTNMTGTGFKTICRDNTSVLMVNDNTPTTTVDATTISVLSATETLFRERVAVTAGKVAIFGMGSSISTIYTAVRTAFINYFNSL